MNTHQITDIIANAPYIDHVDIGAPAPRPSLVDRLSAIAGKPVEITVRGDRSFTISTEHEDHVAGARLADFFSGQAAVSVVHDAECGTFIYLDLEQG